MPDIDYLNLHHSITLSLGWAVFIACLSTFQLGYHLTELNITADFLRCPENAEKILGKCIPIGSASQLDMLSSIMTVGGLLASLFIGFNKSFSHKIARKSMCFVTSTLFFCGSLSMTWGNTYWTMMMGRILNGVACGATVFISPILVNEITPTCKRGLLGSLLQLSVSVGMLVSQLVSIFWANSEQWRRVFGFATITALIQFLAIFTIHESPKWMILNNLEEQQASMILHTYRSDSSSVPHEIEHWRRLSTSHSKVTEDTCLLDSHDSSIYEDIESLTPRRLSIDPPSVSWWEFVFDKQFRKELLATAILTGGMQLSGINSITFFGAKIMKSVAPPNTQIVTITCLFTSCGVLGAILVSPIVDSLGRRPLLLMSAACMLVSSLFIALGIIYTINFMVVVSCLAFIFGHTIGFGALPFMMITELVQHRAAGVAQSIGSSVNWGSNILVSISFPFLQSILGGKVFYVFFATNIAIFLLSYFFIPETKGSNSYHDVWFSGI